jgi:hypothetical protein
MSDELVRRRTETLLSALTGAEYDIDLYKEELGVVETPQDAATLAVASDPPPYSMRDLDNPMDPSTMVIPQDMNAYLSGHTKISTSYAGDWPEADIDNRFGKHHPFHPESNSCPLLHGAVHGSPMYAEHILGFINQLGDNREAERKIRNDVRPIFDIMGDPTESMLQLYNIDRSRFAELSDEGYIENKKTELTNDFGLLSYLFGLEYQTSQQRDTFMDLMSKLGETEDGSPEANTIYNKLSEKTGISWGRALRNWRDRFTPLASWWMRPADKSGPVEAGADASAPDRHHNSPWNLSEEGIVPNHNHHWWQPFLYWGGVGRDIGSLKTMFSESYSKIFNGSWLGDMLFDGIPLMGRHSIAGSHFPMAANTEAGQGELAGVVSSDSMSDLDFERKRANWSGAASFHHHLHPSEIQSQGSMMEIPHSAYMIAPFGRAMMNVGEHGAPLAQFIGMSHPNSNPDYHKLHNSFFAEADKALTREAMRLAGIVNQQLGSEVLIGSLSEDAWSDVEANTIARGNIQQLMVAANYSLMKYGDAGGHSVMPLADLSSGQLSSQDGTLGPVAPTSMGVVPPIFNTGNTDAWGHRMPATLIWSDDPTTGITFSLAEQPFTIMQRTAHEGHVRMIDPAYSKKPIQTKDEDIRLLTSNHMGYPSLVTDLHKSDDDYEPTGVFGKKLITPAHVVKDIDDLTTLKGFSGDWIVQHKPSGDRMLIEKRGKSIEPRVPNTISKDLKDMKGDFTLDAYLDDETLNVVDLLVHKGTDLSFEPLEDRINVLRTLYHSTDNIHFPAPSNCVNSDDEGLVKAIASFDRGEFLIRDATSTFIKEKELHPKWVLFANDDISKSKIYPPLPEVMVKGNTVILEYPEILSPVKVMLAKDDDGIYIDTYEGQPHLVKQAQSQEVLWTPPVAFLLKEGGAGGGDGGGGGTGMVSSTTEGTYQPVHSVATKRKKRKLVEKAPAIIDDEEEDSVHHMMGHVREAIDDAEESLSSEELEEKVEGLKHDHLLRFGGEYGIEQTEDNKWTLNEAIDDDIADTTVVEKFAFPRMNRASADGGAWSGMQADITAPMGATEITDENNTTFADPKNEDREADEIDIPNLKLDPASEVEQPQIEFEGEKVIMRIPIKEKNEKNADLEAQPTIRTDSV